MSPAADRGPLAFGLLERKTLLLAVRAVHGHLEAIGQESVVDAYK